ncbi:protein kinase 4 [Calliphora vicina]|uniref:protein kinase 4 n=1 Tax=Calliphora vicina TaxID=7373 RepID=UPI00325AD807
MAPFKLKFRMGSSRSTSQEHEPDPQVNEALLNHQTFGGIGASSSTIDSVDCNSLVSLNTSERKLLLPNKSNNLKMGFINQNQAKQGEHIPSTPPPTYECVLEEQRQLANATAANDADDDQLNSCLEQLSLNELPCTDPNCRENFNTNNNNNNNNETTNTNQLQQQQQQLQLQTELQQQHEDLINDPNNTIPLNDLENPVVNEDDRKESIDSQEFLLGENMTDSSSDQEREQLENSCSGNCQQYSSDGQQYNTDCQQYNTDGSASCSGGQDERNQNNDFYDPLMNHSVYCNDASHYDEDYQSQMCDHDGNSGECTNECSNECSNEINWDDNQQSSSQLNLQYENCGEQQQHQQYYQQQQQELSQTPEIISNKSSKEIYKDLAKEWGITCKMSDGCRCMECQSHYFDCEYDDNEHQKTDGGLGAGTPMFLTEVMHGSACNIL